MPGLQGLGTPLQAALSSSNRERELPRVECIFVSLLQHKNVDYEDLEIWSGFGGGGSFQSVGVITEGFFFLFFN